MFWTGMVILLAIFLCIFAYGYGQQSVCDGAAGIFTATNHADMTHLLKEGRVCR